MRHCVTWEHLWLLVSLTILQTGGIFNTISSHSVRCQTAEKRAIFPAFRPRVAIIRDHGGPGDPLTSVISLTSGMFLPFRFRRCRTITAISSYPRQSSFISLFVLVTFHAASWIK